MVETRYRPGPTLHKRPRNSLNAIHRDPLSSRQALQRAQCDVLSTLQSLRFIWHRCRFDLRFVVLKNGSHVSWCQSESCHHIVVWGTTRSWQEESRRRCASPPRTWVNPLKTHGVVGPLSCTKSKAAQACDSERLVNKPTVNSLLSPSPTIAKLTITPWQQSANCLKTLIRPTRQSQA